MFFELTENNELLLVCIFELNNWRKMLAGCGDGNYYEGIIIIWLKKRER